MAALNQLEAINYVFTGLFLKLCEVNLFYKDLASNKDLMEFIENEAASNIHKTSEYLSEINDVIEAHLGYPDPITLTDFVRVCDELQKILPKSVDDSDEDDIVKQENS